MIKVRILEGGINHSGEVLEKYEVYELSDEIAKSLIKSKDAEEIKDPVKPAKPEPKPRARKTPAFDAKKKGFVAEATPERPLKPDEVDTTPVVGNPEHDTTPDPKEKVVVVDEKTGEPVKDAGQSAIGSDSGSASPAMTPTVESAMAAPTVK